mmetsp:Transcript_24739/g.79995  ORF Transcript_24739/g.79995 Transcript_24739/m.79995 type:complete len:210 (+) Transcript_24739:945-1574(+)
MITHSLKWGIFATHICSEPIALQFGHATANDITSGSSRNFSSAPSTRLSRGGLGGGGLGDDKDRGEGCPSSSLSSAAPPPLLTAATSVSVRPMATLSSGVRSKWVGVAPSTKEFPEGSSTSKVKASSPRAKARSLTMTSSMAPAALGSTARLSDCRAPSSLAARDRTPSTVVTTPRCVFAGISRSSSGTRTIPVSDLITCRSQSSQRNE